MVALTKFLAAGGGLLAVSFGLQGCGGGGSTPTPKPTPTPMPTTTPTPSPSPVGTTTATTTTGTPQVRTPGGEPADIAKYLNNLYFGFNADDPKAPVGITMNLPSDRTSFYKNVFCAAYDNPRGMTGCSQGRCDCRYSAAVYNNQMLITEGGTVMDIIGRRVMIVFNQTLVEQYMSRCYYVWDGATNGKMNVGCGLGGTADCNDPHSAFGNICASGKLCTKDDPESKGGMCNQYPGGQHPPPTSHGGQYQCSYPGPAIDFHLQEDWKPETETDSLFQMVKFRLANQEGDDPFEKTPKNKMWTEVVMDLRLMMPMIWKDPALVIPAIAYWKDDAIAKADATKIRDEFCQINQLAKKIPLLAIDWKAVVNTKAIKPPPPQPVVQSDQLFVVVEGDNEEILTVV